MKLSVLANLYGALPLEEALKKLSALGIDTIEIGGGGYPGRITVILRFCSAMNLHTRNLLIH